MRPPTARTWTSFELAAAPPATTIVASMPARAAYADADAAVLPVDAQMTPVAPRSTARVTATLIPRSLNEPVGFAPSHLIQRSTPKRSDRRGACRSGGFPSPRVNVTAGAP